MSEITALDRAERVVLALISERIIINPGESNDLRDRIHRAIIEHSNAELMRKREALALVGKLEARVEELEREKALALENLQEGNAHIAMLYLQPRTKP